MTTETPERLTLSIAEAAKALGISRNSCYLACKTGEIYCIKIGSRLLIPKAQLLKLMEENGKGANND